MVDLIYQGDSKIVAPPPAGNEYSYRLPCGWMKSDNFLVGGILYLGQAGLIFVPHKRNLPRHREPFAMGPLDNIEFSLTEARPNRIHRMLVQKLPVLIEAKWPDGTTRLLVPQPEQTLRKIGRVIEELKKGNNR
ncbi:MAG TPA: hypothetical protein VFD58_26420 [Blastocatellia bacterium]|nr:hypothetical protein [Blastocatellia bacterium]